MLITLGSGCIIWGVFAFFFQKSHYFSTESHQQLKNREVYFQVSEREKLVRIMESGKLIELRSLKPSISDGLKLRVMATSDYQVCLSQVVAYETHEHVNITEVQKHSLDDARFYEEFFKQRDLN